MMSLPFLFFAVRRVFVGFSPPKNIPDAHGSVRLPYSHRGERINNG